MKIFITGCHGFLSRCVAEAACAAGGTVFGVGRSSQPPPGWEGIYRQGDAGITDFASWLREFAPDAVFHGAGSASVGRSLELPHEDFLANAGAFSHLLDCCRRSGTTPLIFLPSSAAVYGQPKMLPIAESAPIHPISPYGWHKWCSEQLASCHADIFKTRIVILRLFSIFGEGQRKLLIHELFLRAISEGSLLRLEGTGEEVRDYLSGRDVARAVTGLAGHFETDSLTHPAVFNLASGHGVKVREVARWILDCLESDKSISAQVRERPGNPSAWVADISRLRAALPEWSPEPWETALGDVIRQWQKEAS